MNWGLWCCLGQGWGSASSGQTGRRQRSRFQGGVQVLKFRDSLSLYGNHGTPRPFLQELTVGGTERMSPKVNCSLIEVAQDASEGHPLLPRHSGKASRRR